MYKSYSMELAGRTLTVDIGRVAAQANGAVFIKYGDTTVLSTATASRPEVKAVSEDDSAPKKPELPNVQPDIMPVSLKNSRRNVVKPTKGAVKYGAFFLFAILLPVLFFL